MMEVAVEGMRGISAEQYDVHGQEGFCFRQ